jgi:chromate transporter
MIDRAGWMDPHEFEDAIAACSLLPGPASTQLAIYCAYRVAGATGAVVGGLSFILPAVVLIVALSLLFLANSPPLWVRGAGAGGGAAVAAVAIHAGRGFIGPSLARVGRNRVSIARWSVYLFAGIVAAALLGPLLVFVLLVAGLAEMAVRRGPAPARAATFFPVPAAVSSGGFGALAWVALKVGALSFGGGFVIIPLMQGDAVHVYHWMTGQQFLNAVALGQVTPGPVVATVAAVGYAAHGLPGAAMAGAIGFAPSFAFVLLGGRRFGVLRENRGARGFLGGAGPAAVGAILGAAIPLAGALREAWQFAILAAAIVALLVLRRGVVEVLVGAGCLGVILVLAGLPVPR